MAHELTGRVWLLPDDIETTQILPYSAFGDVDSKLPKARCFADVVPGLAERIEPGDILWAGEGFGQGSSREDAPRALKELGIRLVLAQGFSRIFYRNAINIGLSVAIGDPGDTHDGDILQVNLISGDVTNLTRDIRIRVQPVPKGIRPILSEGGLLAYVKKNGRLSSSSDG